jgi:hypothetical protein
MEIHTAEPLVPNPSLFEVEIGVAELKRYKSLGIDQIPVELIKAEDETLHYEIHKFINSIWSNEEFPQQWKESIIVPICKKSNKTTSNHCGIALLSIPYKNVIQYPSLKAKSICR